jgi:regulator of protease activity HflC (stomatin/prohibitin superfamily)
VDVWREYVSKFTLDELFKPDQLVPPPPPEFPQPTDEEIDPLTQAVSITTSQTTWQNRSTILLREVNVTLSRIIRWFEGGSKGTKTSVPAPSDIPKSSPPEKREPVKKTALQVVNDMVNARLKKPEVDILDDDGRRGLGVIRSQEYQLLKNRGISVLSVSIDNLRLNPAIEETLINRWSASWHENAEAERKQIERRQNVFKSSGQEKAIRQYAERLSSDLTRKKPYGVKETLKTLLMRTRTIILNDDKLRKDMDDEQQALEDILRWVEENE